MVYKCIELRIGDMSPLQVGFSKFRIPKIGRAAHAAPEGGSYLG